LAGHGPGGFFEYGDEFCQHDSIMNQFLTPEKENSRGTDWLTSRPRAWWRPGDPNTALQSAGGGAQFRGRRVALAEICREHPARYE
jgi:hypothetical protein